MNGSRNDRIFSLFFLHNVTSLVYDLEYFLAYSAILVTSWNFDDSNARWR